MKPIIRLFLTICLLAVVLPCTALAEPATEVPAEELTLEAPKLSSAAASGTCGADLTWTLDDEGTLTISGNGAMDQWNYGKAPWYNNRTAIKKLQINSGVTGIGEYAFYNCSNIASVTLPDRDRKSVV